MSSWDSINPFPKGVSQVAAGSNITITGTLANPIISSSGGGGGGGGGVSSITAGSNIVITGTSSNPIISSSGISSLTAGSNITITGTSSNPTISATSSGGGWVGTAASVLSMGSYPITFAGGSLTTDSNSQLTFASVPFPMFQYGEVNNHDMVNTGSRFVSLTSAYENTNYKVFVSVGAGFESVPIALTSVERNSSNAFTIYWESFGSNAPPVFMWMAVGAFPSSATPPPAA